MSTPASGPRPSSGHRRRRNPAVSIVLVIVGMVVLFAAGFGLSVIIRGAGGGGSDAGGTTPPAPTGSATETPLPCVTVTVTPGAGLPTPSQVTSNVYNSTDRAGLAASTAEELQTRGFIIGTIDNDPLGRAVSATAEIRHGSSPDSLASAKLMSFYIPGSVLVDDGRTDATIDTVLGQAFTAIAPQSEVDAALLAPSPSPSGPGCPTPTPTTPAPEPTSTPEPDTTGTAPAP